MPKKRAGICTPGDSSYYDRNKRILSKKYGSKVGTFLVNRLAKMIRDTDDFCMDNLRVAEIGTPEEVSYRKQRDAGCCGSFDMQYIFTDKLCGFIPYKRRFLIGYNYGH